ncbi:MAG: peptidase S16 [Azospirillum sp.]|nr:peptidase S16 [Azospirillum sp.]
MATPGSVPTLDRLPAALPIFPLAGVLLLPRGRLPLNIFEPRYLAMVEDALAGERLVGMIQPTAAERPDRDQPLYRIGCAGRITAFNETDDGRFLITLTGICRFAVAGELGMVKGYRRVEPDWQRFTGDLQPAAPGTGFDRSRLIEGVQAYFKVQGLAASWDAVAALPDAPLVTTLAMICPFPANERQALLEASDLAELCRLLIGLIEMALLQNPGCPAPARH